MQRYFVSPKQMNEESIRILGEDAHHLIRVLRVKIGEQIIVSDGQGTEVLGKVTATDESSVVVERVTELKTSGEPNVEVWIAQSLPKGDKFETVVQKCTELGASRIIPFISERTIVRYDEKKLQKRMERWRKIAKEAAEQSHRSAIPVIESPRNWKALLESVPSTNALLCYEQERSKGIKTALQSLRAEAESQPMLIVIGPEGGLTEAEAKQAQEAGCVTVSLGRRILRTETAAMTALTCIMYEFDEMN